MSGEKKQPDHYRTERQDAAQQNSGVDDAVNKAVVISPGMLSSPGGFGNTSFEGYDLNAMIDIVESANPATLESAATALVDARDAINEAANELSRNLGDVDWEGEAHTAFYTWGMNLTTTALALAGYADEVGTQVLAASSGLASVRKSMPPRDNRIVPKKVDDIPTPQRVEGNAEYTAAVTAEKNRQEAINQMYRLASFYTVSSGMMELAEEPVFPQMPAVGVPEPDPSLRDPIEPRDDQGSLSALQRSVGTHRSSAETEVVRARSDQQLSHQNVVDSVTLPEQHVGTEIDSVGMLPPQQIVTPPTVTSPSATGPNANPVSTAPSFPTVGVPPALRGPAGRKSGFGGMSGVKTPTSAQGRVGGLTGRTPPGRSGMGPTGSMGRAAGPGQTGSRAAGPLGRGVVGGTAKAGGAAARQVGGAPRGQVSGTGAANTARTGAGRANGVVGGKPVTGAAPGANGPRLPRGTVIGGEGAAASRPKAEKPGQRGVIEAPGSTAGAGQASRRSGKGTRNSGHSPGGTSSVRGQAGNQGSGKTRSRRDERRDEASSTD
ncbi:hypothetical protein [Streptomyces sp. NPDC060002]|uniref:hypothetical protein n=1 Tax=Streptomyces sp. NPDC060002 TaxID=3347033 RepID=UPI0036CE3869